MNKSQEKKLEQMYHKAQSLMDMKKNDEAVLLFTQAAKDGYNQAMLTLGSMYYWGIGVEPDTDEAVYWLERDAALGSMVSISNLGYVYSHLDDTKTNNRLAWEYYIESYKHDSKSAFYLGKLIFDNRAGKYKSEKQRLDEAKVFFKKAFDAGEIAAGVYLWKIALLSGESKETADTYYHDGEALLESQQDYGVWAWNLLELGEYEKALPYIEKCLSMEKPGEEIPPHLYTYAECLYGLGRKEDAERIFGLALNAYRKIDKRKLVYEICDKMKSYGLKIE